MKTSIHDGFDEIAEKTIKAYFDYYGKGASMPSLNSTMIGRKYVYLHNSCGLLAKYDFKNEKFYPEFPMQ